MSVEACWSVKAALYVYWILCSAAAFIALQDWPGTQLLRFRPSGAGLLQFSYRKAVLMSAARGKTWETRDRTLKPISDWSVPQFYFWHFYAVGILASSVALLYCTDAFAINGLFWIHVVRRLCETGFLLKYPASSKMHLFAYLYGLSYYVVVPLSISLPAMCPEALRPGQRRAARVTFRTLMSSLATGKTASMLGLLVFLVGSWIQWHAHWMLSQLQRRSSATAPYALPTGGMFEHVSCPHYFGEILIYCGLTIFSQWQYLMLFINIWVVVNLMLGAQEMHQWYKRRFPRYPPHRKALIPSLY